MKQFRSARTKTARFPGALGRVDNRKMRAAGGGYDPIHNHQHAVVARAVRFALAPQTLCQTKIFLPMAASLTRVSQLFPSAFEKNDGNHPSQQQKRDIREPRQLRGCHQLTLAMLFLTDPFT
ncbi:MAG: hypothetical protein WB630_11275 [Candidatus Acidiferrales bacterium]